MGRLAGADLDFLLLSVLYLALVSSIKWICGIVVEGNNVGLSKSSGSPPS